MGWGGVDGCDRMVLMVYNLTNPMRVVASKGPQRDHGGGEEAVRAGWEDI